MYVTTPVSFDAQMLYILVYTDIFISVAEPLLDSSSDSVQGGVRSLPPGSVWMGHLYVQDMCNLQCMATPVSGPPECISLVRKTSTNIYDTSSIRDKRTASSVVRALAHRPIGHGFKPISSHFVSLG